MDVTVYARAGDSQALKVLAAASLVGVTAQIRDIKDLTNSGLEQAPFAPRLAVQLQGSVVLEPNAAIAALGSVGNQQDAQSVTPWLEWDSAVLQPAVLAASNPDAGSSLKTALDKLTTALQSASWLAGGKDCSTADVAVYGTLLPLFKGASPVSTDAVAKAAGLQAWAARVSATAAWSAAASKAAASDEQLLTCYATDAAASVATRVKLPQKGQRNILITSALPYVNNVPHLGNIIGCVLSADVYARYCRARGYNAIYVCGTDEYGTATETKALKEGLTCADLCDKYHAIHAAVYQWFDIQFDKFGRTPSRWQTHICQAIFERLKSQGNIQEQSMDQLYSEALGKFLADRFVIGTCPKCKYDDARGDQCDGCGNLLNPTELINPKCALTGTTPVLRTTKHLFLDLPKLSPDLQRYIDTTSAQGGWSSNCVQVTHAWMRDGLKTRCITRDLKWGTPVPQEGFQDKVFYVWFDAPIGYISITANYTDDWEQWWKNPEDVELVQFMGKDNVPFHTVIFPASLLGTGDAWTMMKSISVTEYLNYEGDKFSKTRGVGVFGNDAKDTGIPVEVWRYYLLSVRPEQSDTDFKWSDLQARNNSELLANLGNFINRSLMFVNKFFDGKIPSVHESKGAEAVKELGAAIQPKVQEYLASMEKIKLREGLRLAMLVSADGNKFIQDTKPWVVVKEDPEHCGTIVASAVGVVRLLAALVAPYMPNFSRKVLGQLNLPESCLDLNDELVAACAHPPSLAPAPGHAIGTPSPLVSAISDETINTLRARYGGNQEERDAKAAAAATPKKASGPASGGKDKPAKAAGSKEGKQAPDGTKKAQKQPKEAPAPSA